MGALGDANKYMQFQAADALRDAAQNEGGGAGLGAGLGAGFAVGGQMANAFGNVGQQGGQGGGQSSQTVACPNCSKQNAAGTNSAAIAVRKWKRRKCRALNAARNCAKARNSVPIAGASQEKERNARTAS
jgi:membrane protease subunit (stomatin/prohibitin family)